MKKIICIALSVSLLTACGEGREAKDKKLALGCQGGVKALLSQGKFDHQIDTVKNTRFSDEAEGRRVLLETTTKNKTYGYVQDQTFSCLFEEGSVVGPFGYKAELIQAVVGEETFGRQGGKILGDMNDFMALTDGVEGAMR